MLSMKTSFRTNNYLAISLVFFYVQNVVVNKSWYFCSSMQTLIKQSLPVRINSRKFYLLLVFCGWLLKM